MILSFNLTHFIVVSSRASTLNDYHYTQRKENPQYYYFDILFLFIYFGKTHGHGHIYTLWYCGVKLLHILLICQLN